MISLEEYKKVLISHYRYECDNTLEKRKLREKELEKKYSDEYLNKIINDTYKVIKKIFNEIEYSYFEISLNGDTTSYISLNLIGGYFSDRLFIDTDDNIISTYILKKTFGSRLIVELKTDEYEITDDPDIMSFSYIYSLYMQGFPKDMKSIKEELFGKNKIKKR